MELCVLHYHYRPGGVRQVIATGLPALVRAGGFTSVHFAGGEANDVVWCEEMERALHPLPVRWTLNAALGYWSESQPKRAEVEAAMDALVSPGAVLWAHNLSVGRNFHLSRAVAQSAEKWKAVWLHHHDWWWDGRWQRWPELLAQGAGDLVEAVKLTLPAAENVRHFAINPRDANLLSAWRGDHCNLLDNPVARQPVTPQETAHAKEWLRHITGHDTHWLYPCRMLRRKNIAEALLVQRWLAPEAATVTTGGPSSAAELTYARELKAAAVESWWPLFTGVCAEHSGAPSVPALMAAADAVVVTSLQEGFGLPYREAALAQRPLYARILPCIGDSVPAAGAWHEVPVCAGAFDEEQEASRTSATRAAAILLLPPELAGEFKIEPCADFGSLSLQAQIEVLCRKPRSTRPDVFPQIRHAGTSAVEHPPELWAARLLQCVRSPVVAPSSGWEQRAPEFLQPLVREWLRRPLLWPS